MSKKIIFWISNSIGSFLPCKFIKEQITESEIYSIIDIPDNQKNFYENQDIVSFKKKWFLHNHIQKNNSPDINYLANIEEKYAIPFWEIACNERIFYNYNDFYKFSENEVLSIIEQECKLFEKILDEVKPDVLILPLTVFQQDHIFYKMCKARSIQILMLKPTGFARRYIINSGDDNLENTSTTSISKKSYEEIYSYYKSHNSSEQANNLKNDFQNSKNSLLKSFFKYISSNNSSEKNLFSYRGRTKTKVIYKTFFYELKKYFRESFINNNLLYDFDKNLKYVYFPLHIVQERTLLIGAPYYTNQLEIISNIVKALPIGYTLLVKEHPIMSLRGWRSISEYKKIMNLPNVKFIHHSIPSETIIRNSSLVISVNGTSSLEAIFLQKPSITFVETNYSHLSSVHVMKSYTELYDVIRNALKSKVNLEEVNKYVDLMNNNSFELDLHQFSTQLQNEFSSGGFLIDANISIEKVKSFINSHSDFLNKLSEQFSKKINLY